MADDNNGRVSTREFFVELGKVEGRLTEKYEAGNEKLDSRLTGIEQMLYTYVERSENTREIAKKNTDDVERLERRDWWGSGIAVVVAAIIAAIKGS